MYNLHLHPNCCFRKLRITLFLILACTAASAQTNTWTGGVGNWMVPTNWSLGIVPTDAHDVVINTLGDTLYLLAGDTTNVRSVSMSNGVCFIVGQASMTSALLRIDNAAGNGLQVNNSSFFIRSSSLFVGETDIIGQDGIVIENLGMFVSEEANMYADRCTGVGLRINNGSFSMTLASNLLIGSTNTIGQQGIFLTNSGAFSTNESTTQINRSAAHGLHINGGSFSGTFSSLLIGNTSNIGQNGIFIENAGSFSSYFTSVSIDNITNPNYHGIEIKDAGTQFNNQGFLNIGEAGSPIARNGIYVRNGAEFRNIFGSGDGDPSGQVNISNTGEHGILIHDANSRFINQSQVYIGNSGPIDENGVYIYGMGEFENNDPALLQINDITQFNGIEIEGAGSVFGNLGGFVRIGNLQPVRQNGIRLRNGAFFNNLYDYGSIEIDNITDNDGILLENAGTLFDNNGMLRIGQFDPVKWDGIRLRNGADFNNKELGNIQISNISDFDGILVEDAGSVFNNEPNAIISIGAFSSVKRNGIYVANSGNFFNQTGGTIYIDQITGTLTGEGIGLTVSGGTATMVNDGTLNIGANTAVERFGIGINGCVFTNNGTIEINRITQFDAVATLGTGADFNNNSILKIGNLGAIGRHGIAIGAGTFDNTAAATIEINQTSASGFAVNLAGGTFTNIGATQLGNLTFVPQGIGGTAAFNNAGLLAFHTVSGTGVASPSTVQNNSTFGLINVVGATGQLILDGVINNNAGAALQVLNNAARLEVNGTLNNNSSVSNIGILSGIGNIQQNAGSSFSNTAGAVVEPGNSPGTLTVAGTTGNFDLGAANFRVEINGTTAGLYDVLDIANTATINSAVLVATVGYTLVVGDQVTILKAGTPIVGAFASFSLPSGWFVNYNLPASGDITLSFGASLPVEWLSFEVTLEQKFAQLRWETGSESDNLGFYVERSADARNWGSIGFVPAKETTGSTYQFSDPLPVREKTYYRIRQEDLNGQQSFSVIRAVSGSGSSTFTWINANPAIVGEGLSLRYTGDAAFDGTVQIIDLNGRLLYQQVIAELEQGSTWALPVQTMALGTYYLHFASDSGARQTLVLLVQ